MADDVERVEVQVDVDQGVRNLDRLGDSWDRLRRSAEQNARAIEQELTRIEQLQRRLASAPEDVRTLPARSIESQVGAAHDLVGGEGVARQNRQKIIAAELGELDARERVAAETRRAAIRQSIQNQAAERADRIANQQQIDLINARRAAIANLNSQSSGRDIRGNFLQGFSGTHNGGANAFAFSAGQAVRFGAVYGAIYRILTGIEQAFAFTLTEAIDFQQGITELSLAVDRSREDVTALANNLADTANQFGFDSREGIQTGTKALGVFRALNAPADVQGAIARSANRSISQQAFLSGADPQELTASLAAIAQAFGAGAESIGRITDTMTFMEKNFGIAAGSLSESMPAVASLFEQTGFSLEQAAGALAAVQSRTGQSPGAVSGLLSQILTREGEGTVQEIFQQLGVVGDTFSDRLLDLARKINTISDVELGQVSATFGRGRSQSAAIALVQELPRIFGLAENARRPVDEGGAIGLTARQAEQRLNDVGGQLVQLQGALKELSRELSQSGIVDVLGAAVIGLREFSEATSNVLKVWNQIPDLGQQLIIAFAALRTIVPLLRGPAGRFGQGIAAGASERIAAAGTVGVRTGARAFGGSAVAAFGGPVAVGALAGLTAISLAKGAFDSLNAASQKATDTLTTIGQVDVTSLDSVRGARFAAQDAARERRASDPSLLTDPIESVVGFFTNEAGRRQAETRQLEQMSTILQRIENRRAAEESGRGSQGPFGDLSTTSVAEGFKKIQEGGGTAASALDTLSTAIRNAASSAEAAAKLFDADDVADNTVANLGKIFSEIDWGNDPNIKLSTNTKIGPLEFAFRDFDQVADSTYGELADRIKNSVLADPNKARAFLQQRLGEANADGSVTIEESRDIASQFFDQFLDTSKFKDVAEGDLRAARAKVQQALGNAFVDAARGQQDALTRTPDNSAYEYRNEIVEGNLDALNAIPDYRPQARRGRVQKVIVDLQRIIRDGREQGKDVTAFVRQLNEFQSMAADLDTQISNEPLQVAAATSIARAAGTRSIVDDARANVQKAAADLEALRPNRGRSNQDEIAFQNALATYNRNKLALADATRQEAAALRDILGAQVGSQLAAAISAVRDANAAVEAAVTEAEKNAAQIQKLEADRQKREAQIRARSANRLLRQDRTNPLTQAREEERIAREIAEAEERFFRSTGSAGGRRITREERQRLNELNVEAQNAATNRQQIQFEQNLNATQQAQKLGQISQGQYLDYLKQQELAIRQQMEGMTQQSQGYYQAQQNLNEILGLQQEVANSMNSQFNLGDIKLPTVYDVRRYIAGQGAGVGVQGAPSAGTMINISGADTGQIIQILDQYLVGGGNTYTSSGY